MDFQHLEMVWVWSRLGVREGLVSRGLMGLSVSDFTFLLEHPRPCGLWVLCPGGKGQVELWLPQRPGALSCLGALMGLHVGGIPPCARVPTPGHPARGAPHTSELLAPPQVHQLGLHLRAGDGQRVSLGSSCLISCSLLALKEGKPSLPQLGLD